MELAPSISSSTPYLNLLRFVRQSFHLRNSSSLMGRASILLLLLHLLLLFLTPSLSWPREPNTDGFFVVEFLRQMGAALPSENGAMRNSSSSSLCPREVSCEVEGGRVVRLVASGVGLRGSMPGNTIGKLGMLRQLDLSFNKITAFSTDFWGLGSSLQKLDLSFNTINGSLPNDVGNLGKLQVLNLSFNLLSGRIPPNIGSLGGLMHLNLSHNSIHGSVPKDILQCKSLVSMDLSSNNLSSDFPRDLRNLRDLQHLNLAGNMITGVLPISSGLEFLRHLNLSRNSFVDSVSGALHRPLQVVDLSYNHFTGHISQVSLSSHLLPNLTYLDLSSNRLSGALFANLHEARSLRHLDVANNRFSQENFPSRIGELSKLEFLSLSGIGITGKMPDELVKLSNLRVLDLSLNHLEGQIPSLSTESLQILDLSRNNLTGEIPLDLQRRLLGIPSFNFSYNNLTFCSSSFPSKLLNSAFIGSHNDCPIAANPEYAKRVRDRHWKRNVALAIAFSSLFFLMGLICLALVLRKRSGLLVTKQVVGKEDPNISGPFSFETDSTTWVADVKDANSVPVVIFEKPLLDFTFADLLSATSNFDRGTLLAEGKFGPVYRGLLPAGFNVAIKVLVHGSTLTDQEAAMELERLGRIKHPNLVPLTGYCLAGDQRIAVYDYMEHGNLQNLLHDLPLGVQTEDWSNDTWEDDNDGVHSITSEGQTTWKFRHRIALGTARALAFLHHGCIPQIIHKDVKASSVYLDSAFEPRLSDFGLAKIVGSNFEDEIARVSPGYTPPELSGSEVSLIATSKSDVYAFGVVLFELITGKKPIGDEYPEEKDATLVSWVRGLLKRGQLADAIDQKIYETGQVKKMEEALRIGYLCTADSPSKRPSMQQIVGLLKDIDPGASYQ